MENTKGTKKSTHSPNARLWQDQEDKVHSRREALMGKEERRQSQFDGAA